MSEQGWKDFLAAEGIDDWVVLHGGATAVFRVGSLEEAARLAGSVAAIPGLAGSGALLTVADDQAHRPADAATSGGSSRGISSLPGRSPRSPGRTVRAADRAAVQEVQLAIAAKPDAIDLGFWRAVLGYDPMSEDNAVDPLGHGIDRVDAGPRPRPSRCGMRCTSTCPSPASTRRHGSPPPSPQAAGSWTTSEAPGAWILADRAGNKVCIAAWPDGSVPPGDEVGTLGDT